MPLTEKERIARRAERLIRRIGGGFHWDTPARCYVWIRDGKRSPLWPGAQRDIDKAYADLERVGLEPFEFGLGILEKLYQEQPLRARRS